MSLFKRFQIYRLKRKLAALQQQRLNQQVKDEAIQKEIKIYFKLYQLYLKLQGKKKFPFAFEMAKISLSMAAQLNSAEAMYLLGNYYLDEGKFREAIEKEGLFSSEENQRLTKIAFENAHAYLSAADKLGHILAKRIHGTCYIFAWGVAQDKDKGFKMVVDSIAKENSWDKASKIFAALGLNKPEFFEAFVKHQANQR